MIIWGSKCKNIIESKGTFNCPECSTPQPYELIKVAKYFTLYFIPLFQMQTLGKYIKCSSCNSEYEETVLQYKPPTEEERLMYAAHQDLLSGTPVQMAVKKMVNQGVCEDSALKIVNDVAGSGRKSCRSCNLDFVNQVQKCSCCGSAL